MTDSSKIRLLSKALFGNSVRLEIAAAIYAQQGSPFSTMSIHYETGIFYARVQEQVKALERVGMIRPVESNARSVEYKAEPSTFWELSHRLLQEIQ